MKDFTILEEEKSQLSSREQMKMLLFFNTIDEQLLSLRLEAQENFTLLNEQIRNFYAISLRLTEDVARLAICLKANQEKLSGPVKHSLDRISSLVTDLQYNDIIQQKLDHIGQTNEKICAALEQSFSIQDWLPVLPDVVQLQAALLDFTDTEYQRAFRKMKACLLSFRENTLNVGEIGKTLLNWLSTQEAETQIAAQVKEIVDRLVQQIDNLLSDINEPKVFADQVKHIRHQLKEFALQLPIEEESESQLSGSVLKQLEELYTMQSERVLYQRYIKVPKETQTLVVEGEVELF